MPREREKGPKWHQAETDIAKRFWNEGLNYTQIANRMNLEEHPHAKGRLLYELRSGVPYTYHVVSQHLKTLQERGELEPHSMKHSESTTHKYPARIFEADNIRCRCPDWPKTFNGQTAKSNTAFYYQHKRTIMACRPGPPKPPPKKRTFKCCNPGCQGAFTLTESLKRHRKEQDHPVEKDAPSSENEGFRSQPHLTRTRNGQAQILDRSQET